MQSRKSPLQIIICLKTNNLFLSNSDVDVTGISEYSANNSNYQVVDGSVILQTDNEKHQDTDNSVSVSESDDQTEETDRYAYKTIQNNNSYPTSVLYSLHPCMQCSYNIYLL